MVNATPVLENLRNQFKMGLKCLIDFGSIIQNVLWKILDLERQLEYHIHWYGTNELELLVTEIGDAKFEMIMADLGCW